MFSLLNLLSSSPTASAGFPNSLLLSGAQNMNMNQHSLLASFGVKPSSSSSSPSSSSLDELVPRSLTALLKNALQKPESSLLGASATPSFTFAQQQASASPSSSSSSTTTPGASGALSPVSSAAAGGGGTPAPLPLAGGEFNVLRRMVLDVTSALGASFCVAPAICIIDKAIIENASGANPLVVSLKKSIRSLVTEPIQFLKRPEFRWIWAVYGVTYITANFITTACERTSTNPHIPKFVGVSSANILMSILKDRAFTRMFGVVAPKPVPVPSILLFGARDSLSILASFNLPIMMSHYLQEQYKVSKGLADTLPQLLLPVAIQTISTPLHLTALNIYNQPDYTPGERLAFIKKEYVKSTLARMSRIFPAFGIGGVGNKTIRTNLLAKFES